MHHKCFRQLFSRRCCLLLYILRAYCKSLIEWKLSSVKTHWSTSINLYWTCRRRWGFHVSKRNSPETNKNLNCWPGCWQNFQFFLVLFCTPVGSQCSKTHRFRSRSYLSPWSRERAGVPVCRICNAIEKKPIAIQTNICVFTSFHAIGHVTFKAMFQLWWRADVRYLMRDKRTHFLSCHLYNLNRACCSIFAAYLDWYSYFALTQVYSIVKVNTSRDYQKANKMHSKITSDLHTRNNNELSWLTVNVSSIYLTLTFHFQDRIAVERWDTMFL